MLDLVNIPFINYGTLFISVYDFAKPCVSVVICERKSALPAL